MVHPYQLMVRSPRMSTTTTTRCEERICVTFSGFFWFRPIHLRRFVGMDAEAYHRDCLQEFPSLSRRDQEMYRQLYIDRGHNKEYQCICNWRQLWTYSSCMFQHEQFYIHGNDYHYNNYKSSFGIMTCSHDSTERLACDELYKRGACSVSNNQECVAFMDWQQYYIMTIKYRQCVTFYDI